MSDHLAAEVARRQRARLERSSRVRSGAASPWKHVPVARLFEREGNALLSLRDGTVETGHQPFHGSNSGRCVSIAPDAGLWYCRGCRRGGDAATLLMALTGEPYRRVARTLAEQYGPPIGGPAGSRRPRRLRYVREVVLG